MGCFGMCTITIRLAHFVSLTARPRKQHYQHSHTFPGVIFPAFSASSIMARPILSGKGVSRIECMHYYCCRKICRLPLNASPPKELRCFGGSHAHHQHHMIDEACIACSCSCHMLTPVLHRRTWLHALHLSCNLGDAALCDLCQVDERGLADHLGNVLRDFPPLRLLRDRAESGPAHYRDFETKLAFFLWIKCAIWTIPTPTTDPMTAPRKPIFQSTIHARRFAMTEA